MDSGCGPSGCKTSAGAAFSRAFSSLPAASANSYIAQKPGDRYFRPKTMRAAWHEVAESAASHGNGIAKHARTARQSLGSDHTAGRCPKIEASSTGSSRARLQAAACEGSGGYTMPKQVLTVASERSKSSNARSSACSTRASAPDKARHWSRLCATVGNMLTAVKDCVARRVNRGML